ncbi:hypothetical protein [Sphingobacterium detergens]|uniref:hypothetical protein n=1 Tax=Sphingobacterium detergens TaxID=1145106 RepID=UPI000FA904FA
MIENNGINILPVGTDNVQEGFAQAMLVEIDTVRVLCNPELLERGHLFLVSIVMQRRF